MKLADYRLVRIGLLDSEVVNSLSEREEIFFRRLLQIGDDFGRFDARAAILRSLLYPLQLDRVSENDINEFLTNLNNKSLIFLYEVNNKQYGEIPNYDQKLRRYKETYPPPSDKCRTLTASCGQVPDIDGKKPPERKGKEEEEETKEKTFAYVDENFKKAHKKTCERFSISEIKNQRTFLNVGSALTLISKNGLIHEYLAQLEAYFSYKNIAEEKICNIETWLFGKDRDPTTAHWNREDWVNKLNNFKGKTTLSEMKYVEK